MGHLPGGHAPGRAPGMMGLADDVAVQNAGGGEPGSRDPVLDGCGHGSRHGTLRWPWHASLMSSSHGRQSTPSSAPEVNPPVLLTIGELARRAGVTTSTLRYYEELGLLPGWPGSRGSAATPNRRPGRSAPSCSTATPGSRWPSRRPWRPRTRARPVNGDGWPSASWPNSTSRSRRRKRPAMPSGTGCAALTRTSRDAPTSTPASPPGWPASRWHDPTSSCTASGSRRSPRRRADRSRSGLRARMGHRGRRRWPGSPGGTARCWHHR